MKKIFISMLVVMFSSFNIAQAGNTIGLSSLNGSYSGDGAIIFQLNGNSKANIIRGNACYFGGKLTQPNKNKPVFIYIDNVNEGEGSAQAMCESPSKITITVLQTNSTSKIATKIKTSGSKIRDFNGIYMLEK